MRLLADENVPLPVVEGLREDGHDVEWVAADSPGIGDRSVMQQAREEERVLLTFDKDFGTLTFQTEEAHPVGILLFRLPPLSKKELADFVVGTIRDREDWEGHFAVIEKQQIRMRPLPNK